MFIKQWNWLYPGALLKLSFWQCQDINFSLAVSIYQLFLGRVQILTFLGRVQISTFLGRVRISTFLVHVQISTYFWAVFECQLFFWSQGMSTSYCPGPGASQIGTASDYQTF